MRAVKSSHADQEAEIDMTPMIDCVFQLLIFFMCCATMSKVDKSAEISLPVASNAAEQKDPSNRGTISVLLPGMHARDGEAASDAKPFAIYGELMTDEELQQAIENQVKAQPALRVYLRADQRSDFALVRRAMTACANAGVQDVIFGTYAQDASLTPE